MRERFAVKDAANESMITHFWCKIGGGRLRADGKVGLADPREAVPSGAHPLNGSAGVTLARL
jgi:hypothetical protein